MKGICALFISVCFVSNAYPDTICVDSNNARVRIQVGSAGVFGVFGHDHLIEARGIQGCAELDSGQLERSSVSLTFPAAQITVLDPEHPKDRPEVQRTMETEVLQLAKFPEIQFKSERVRITKAAAAGNSSGVYDIIVDGPLTMRGRSVTLSIPMRLEMHGASARVTGRYKLKQSAFGIEPVRVMGGAVRVKDELQLDFDLQLKTK